jgi:pyrimidine-nucleoside phosphorylase
MDIEEFIEIVNKVGGAIIAQSKELVLADKKLYSLRDVTGTVDSIPLIASSIMSKKIASGSDAIVLDVKVGNGAFMQKLEDAILLSKMMVDIGNSLGRETVAYITDMNQPLGEAIGNSLEVIEAIDILKNKDSGRLSKIIEMLGGESLKLGMKARTIDEGKKLIKESILNGSGLKKFAEIIKAQGGSSEIIDNHSLLPESKFKFSIKSHLSGYLHSVQTKILGQLANYLGAGRTRKEDEIDLSVGIIFKKKIGDYINNGEEIATIFANSEEKGKQASADFLELIQIKNEKVDPIPLIYYRVSREGLEKLY